MHLPNVGRNAAPEISNDLRGQSKWLDRGTQAWCSYISCWSCWFITNEWRTCGCAGILWPMNGTPANRAPPPREVVGKDLEVTREKATQSWKECNLCPANNTWTCRTSFLVALRCTVNSFWTTVNLHVAHIWRRSWSAETPLFPQSTVVTSNIKRFWKNRATKKE